MKVYTSERFDRSLQRLVKGDKSLVPKIKWVVGLLEADTQHPSLRRHKVSGVDRWSVSINLRVRVIYRQVGDEMYLLDIGSHDDVY